LKQNFIFTEEDQRGIGGLGLTGTQYAASAGSKKLIMIATPKHNARCFVAIIMIEQKKGRFS
jgi:D-arabinose 1-dehydrogenase-like Zn-dependent alcohol dehydrogenase